MKKSIRIAAAMCAAVFTMGVLAGCTFGGSDKDGDGENGGSGTVQNRFEGKTLEYENTRRRDYDDGSWYTSYRHETIMFTASTATVHLEWHYTSSNSAEDEKDTEVYEYTYVLESVNGKNVLHMTEKNPKYYFYDDKDERKECTFDEYVNAEYNGISSGTKELLRKVESTLYMYYEFTDNNTVKLYDNYYVGDMTKSSERFHYDNRNSASSGYTYVSFGQSRLRLEQSKQENGNWTYTEYWGIPQFNSKNFTVEMYRREYQNESRNDKYIKTGTVEGSYAINGTGSKCSGTISFTKFPNEMKNLFADSYQIQNYDLDHDDDDPDYTEYTIK